MRINLGAVGTMDCSSGVCFDNSQVPSSNAIPSDAILNQAISQLPSTSQGFQAGSDLLNQPNMTAAEIAALPDNPPAKPTSTATIIAIAAIFGLVVFTGEHR